MTTYTYKVPLHLTTPAIRGPKVTEAQLLLSGHNRFANSDFPIHTYNGPIDHVWDEECMVATKRSKFLLGYPKELVLNGAFGHTLYGYLTSERLPLDFQERRKERINTNHKKSALEVARGEIGTKEDPPDSNLQKYGEWYKWNGVAWCAIFMSWCEAHANPATPRIRYASVPLLANDAKHGHNGLSFTTNPQSGDLASYTIDGQPNEHIAFFDEWVSPINHYEFYDIGGNTGPENISNGGAVMRQKRSVLMVSHFIRVW